MSQGEEVRPGTMLRWWGTIAVVILLALSALTGLVAVGGAGIVSPGEHVDDHEHADSQSREPGAIPGRSSVARPADKEGVSSTADRSAERSGEAPSVDPADAEVSVVFGQEGFGRDRYRRDGTVKIWASVVNTTRDPTGPVANEPLTIEVTRPDDTVDTFNRTTDAEGSAVVAYGLAGKERGVYDVAAVATDLDISALSSSFNAEREIEILPGSGPVQRGQPVTAAVRVRSNRTGIGGVDVPVEVERPDGSTRTETVTTGGDGIETVAFTPTQIGEYRLTAGPTYNFETYSSHPAVGEVRFRESGYVSAAVGEIVPITGLVQSGGGPLADQPVAVRVTERYGSGGTWVNTTTNSVGHLVTNWTVPTAAEDGDSYEIELYDTQERRIGHKSPTLVVSASDSAVDVVSATDPTAGDAPPDPAVSGLSLTGQLGDSQGDVFAPGGAATGFVRVTDSYSPYM